MKADSLVLLLNWMHVFEVHSAIPALIAATAREWRPKKNTAKRFGLAKFCLDFLSKEITGAVII